MKKKITEKTILTEISKKPELTEILIKYNFPCLGCPLAKFEMESLTLGQVCKMYGIDLKILLKELNKAPQ